MLIGILRPLPLIDGPMDLHDPRWEPGQAPHELGRQPFGRISIANSDSEAYAYVQSAIDASIRAVGEVVS
jgi:spermidine dehydrogenase